MYFVYGIVLYKFNNYQKININRKYLPTVTVIICAYNEEKAIESKIQNTIKLKYPLKKLKILVFDNGSNDKTYDLAKKYESDLVSVQRLSHDNRGKSFGLNVAFNYASSEIIAITDVDCLLDEEILLNSIPYFSNEKIGAVTGSQILLNADESFSSQMEYSLRGYYRVIHTAESNLDSTIIYNGEFTAFRKHLIKKLDEDVGADDIQIAVKTRQAGFRALFLSSANFYEYAPSTPSLRWKQKVRRGSQVVQALIRYRFLMFRKLDAYCMLIYPWNFFMYVISPFMFISLIMLSLYLLYVQFSEVIIIFGSLIISAFIAICILSLFLNKKGLKGILSSLFTFIDAQLSLFVGAFTLLSKNTYKWEPIEEMRRY